MDSRRFLIKKLGSRGGLTKKRKRYAIYSLFKDMKFEVGCEVGVASGRNAEKMVQRIPGLKLYLVDNYFYTKEYKHKSKWTAATCLKRAKARFARLHKKYDFEEIFIGKDSLDAVKDFKDESLDFVYIDANHAFDYAIRDIIEWSRKVRVGGVIAGHDYYMFDERGVVFAVDAYIKAHNVKPVYFTDEKRHTYFWVKTKRNPSYRTANGCDKDET